MIFKKLCQSIYIDNVNRHLFLIVMITCLHFSLLPSVYWYLTETFPVAWQNNHLAQYTTWEIVFSDIIQHFYTLLSILARFILGLDMSLENDSTGYAKKLLGQVRNIIDFQPTQMVEYPFREVSMERKNSLILLMTKEKKCKW